MDENGKQTFIFYSDEFEKQGELTVSGVEYNWSSKHEEREWKDDGYKGDWKVMSDDSGKSHGGIMSLCLNDFDQSCDDFRTIYLTQTLFNTDEKYEFLMPLYSSTIETGEDDRDGDGVVDFRYTSTNNSIIGFQIVSEDGTVLQTVNFDGDFTLPDNGKGDVDLLKIHSKLYLCFNGYTSCLLYSIDSATSSVRMMTMENLSSVPAGGYNLSGRLTRSEKGVNIIRMSDGTTKKVLVK